MQYLANKRIYIYEYTKEPDITLTQLDLNFTERRKSQ